MTRPVVAKWPEVAIAIVAVAMFLYHMVSTRVLLQGPIEHQNTHLAFALVVILLGMIKKWPRSWPLALLLVLLAIGATTYIKVFYEDLEIRMGVATTPDIVVGTIILLLGLLATYLAFGIPMVAVGILIYAYIVFGHYLPDPWGHIYFDIPRVINLSVTGLKGGVYGELLSTSANVIFLYMVYGCLLEITGARNAFVELGKVVGRKLRGGPALTATVSSALVGMVTGSVAANVMITGSFTIPLMKKVGFKPEQAGAVEAAASTGGQVMPPIMGASGFIMATLLAIPYAKVMKMAFVPALLFFLAVALYIQFMAVRMRVAPSMERIDSRVVWTSMPLFVGSLLVIVVLLLLGFTPGLAAFWAIISLLGMALLRKTTRPSLSQLVRGITEGARSGAGIAVSCAVLGPLTVIVSATGLGMKISSLVEVWSGGFLPIALLITFLVCIILGTGLITVAAYVIVVATALPALVRMGIGAEQAHFFVLYAAVFGYLTPPVAIGALVAAGLAGASYVRTAWESMKIGLPGLLLPFLIAAAPELLLRPSASSGTPLSMVSVLVAAIVALACLAAAMNRTYLHLMNLWQVLLAIIGVAGSLGYLLSRDYTLFGAGMLAFACLTVWQLATRTAEIKAILPRGGERHGHE